MAALQKIALLSFLFFAGPVQAQGVFDMGSLTATLAIDHVTQSEEAKSHNGADAQPKNEKSKSLTYVVSPSLRQAKQQRFFSSVEGGPELGDMDLVGQMEKAMQPIGFHVNNVADAYTLWWVASWKISNSSHERVSLAQYTAVKQQASRLISETEVASASDAQKQELAEELLLQTIMMEYQYDLARGNPANQIEFAKSIASKSKTMGLDLTALDLTEQGFVLRNQ